MINKIFLFILFISTTAFTQLKENDLIGVWQKGINSKEIIDNIYRFFPDGKFEYYYTSYSDDIIGYGGLYFLMNNEVNVLIQYVIKETGGSRVVDEGKDSTGNYYITLDDWDGSENVYIPNIQIQISLKGFHKISSSPEYPHND
jgi:hypothetical protein